MVFAQQQAAAFRRTRRCTTETAEQTFKADAVIYTLHPHAHFRGKSASFVANYPDGATETLLNVPAYDFNWQATYELDEADDRAGRHEDRVHAGVRQLEPEQGEPRSEPRGDVGRADLGRNGVRRDPLSQREGRRRGADAEGPVAGRAVHREAGATARGRRSRRNRDPGIPHLATAVTGTAASADAAPGTDPGAVRDVPSRCSRRAQPAHPSSDRCCARGSCRPG